MASQSGADTDIDTTNKTTTTTATTATTSVDANPHSSTEQPRDAGPTPNRGLTVGIICVLAGGLAMMWVVSNISFPQPAFDTIQWYALGVCYSLLGSCRSMDPHAKFQIRKQVIRLLIRDCFLSLYHQ
jgi:hypothetical protein